MVNYNSADLLITKLNQFNNFYRNKVIKPTWNELINVRIDINEL